MDPKINRHFTYAVDISEFDEPVYLKAANNRDMLFELRRWAMFHRLTSLTITGWRVIVRAPSLDNINERIHLS